MLEIFARRSLKGFPIGSGWEDSIIEKHSVGTMGCSLLSLRVRKKAFWHGTGIAKAGSERSALVVLTPRRSLSSSMDLFVKTIGSDCPAIQNESFAKERM